MKNKYSNYINLTVMFKSIFRLLPVAVVVMGVFLSSCKDDEPTKYQLTFAEATKTINEADGEVEIEIKLDKPAPADITIDYTVSGSAIEFERAKTEQVDPDFGIEDVGKIQIDKGESSATISLFIYTDELIEEDETITITLDKADVNHVEFQPGTKMDITLKQQDGLVILLEWPAASTTGVADMDMFVRIGETASPVTYDGVVTGSIYRGFDSNYEAVFIPKTYTGALFDLGYTNTTFGISYTYYDGTLSPLTFKSTFIDFVNGAAEGTSTRQSFEASYTFDNRNKWAGTTYPTIVAQTFQNDGNQFTNISSITTQATSSRSGSSSRELSLTAKASGLKVNMTKRALPANIARQLGLN